MNKLIYLYFLFFSGFMVNAQEQHGHDTHSTHHPHHNHLALFVGGTSQYHLGKNITSLGIDYMRFFKNNPKWGVSSSLEVILADDTQWLLVAPIVYKPLNNLWLRSGPGFELVRNEKDKVIADFVMRFGIGYDIEFKNLVISPSFDFDFIRYHPAFVYGVNIGMGF